MRILIVGGAGYVGSHVAQACIDAGHDVTILDNLSTGHAYSIPAGCEFFEADMTAGVVRVPDSIIFLAAKISIADSVSHPQDYFRVNVDKTLYFLGKCFSKNYIKNIVFASSAAAEKPHTIYGEGKRTIEQFLYKYGPYFGKNTISLRLFNVAGADEKGRRGEEHTPETHLIPNVLGSIRDNTPVKIYGNCLRDYVHVQDVADAFLRAATCGDSYEYLEVGTGEITSTKQIIELAEFVTGKPVQAERLKDRHGDDIFMVSGDHQATRKALDWTPKRVLLDIIETASRWHQCR